MTTPRENLILSLERKTPQRHVPHFELEFFLTMEAFGKIHPSQRKYPKWEQMSAKEQRLHREDVAQLYVNTYDRFGLSGTIFSSPAGWSDEDTRQSLEHIRDTSGMKYFLTIHGDATFSIPSGEQMMDFITKLADDPQGMKDLAQQKVDTALERMEKISQWGLLDGLCLCADYCFNDNPFLSPDMFDEFVAPYLTQLIAGYRELGFYVIKHTDGNIMPILDSLVAANPHALHSLDPQGGVDLEDVKQRVGDQVCLFGNVNCGLLQTGKEEDVERDVRRALRQGMPGGGYVFGTSNCIYTGMSLERYEKMLQIWREEGVYSNN